MSGWRLFCWEARPAGFSSACWATGWAACASYRSPIYFPELFPTRLRASGLSACFNLGGVLGAVILLVRGSLGASLGLRRAVVLMSGLFWLGLIILLFAPETRGRDLPE
jgi:hypothetical protein